MKSIVTLPHIACLIAIVLLAAETSAQLSPGPAIPQQLSPQSNHPYGAKLQPHGSETRRGASALPPDPREREEALAELEKEGIISRIPPPAYIKGLKPYEHAQSLLEGMLSGALPLSLKDAFYITEKTFGNCYLEYDEYSALLKQSADFIRAWLKQRGHASPSQDALHAGIQAFMRDTLSLTTPSSDGTTRQVVQHLPFAYDYVDFEAEQDFRNYFVTKTLATGTGQCNTLPAVYLLLAEQLGATTYLSYAPLHALIKYPSSDGTLNNYEPTMHWNISDAWYAEHLRIPEAALRSGIYLDTVNTRQIVAAAMLELAHGYLKKYQMVDEAFFERCIEQSLQHFPGGANLQAWTLNGILHIAKLDHLMQRHGVRSEADMAKVPAVKKAHDELLAINTKIMALGWTAYSQTAAEGAVQSQRARQGDADAKTRKNMFIKSRQP